MDVAKLLAEDDADTRMRGFLLELKTLPARIPVNGTLKLPFLGLRWASRSLSAVGSARCNPGTATCTLRGLTTKGKFPVIVLGSTLRVGRSAEHPGGIAISIPGSDVLFLVSNLRELAPEVPVLMNGIMSVPGELQSFAEPGSADSSVLTSRIAMAVHIPHLVFPPNASSTDDEPMLCECLFYLGLAEVPPHMNVDRNGEAWAKGVGGTMVEGRFISVRVTVT